MKNAAAFEITLGRHVKGSRQRGSPLGTKLSVELLRRPHVEAALFAFAVGVEAGVEATIRRRHLALDEGKRFFSDPSKGRFLGQLPGIEIGAGEERVVVEHLFEVRDKPALVDAVAVKAAAGL